MPRHRKLAAVLLIGGLAACSEQHQGRTAAAPAAEQPTPAAARVEPRRGAERVPAEMTEAEVLGVLDEAAGKLATDATVAAYAGNDLELRALALEMVADYAGYRERQRALQTLVALDPSSSALRMGLASAASRDAETLRSLEGAAFDRAFLAHAIEDQSRLLRLIDSGLLDRTRRSELRALIGVDLREALLRNVFAARDLDDAIQRDVDGTRRKAGWEGQASIER